MQQTRSKKYGYPSKDEQILLLQGKVYVLFTNLTISLVLAIFGNKLGTRLDLTSNHIAEVLIFTDWHTWLTVLLLEVTRTASVASQGCESLGEGLGSDLATVSIH